MPIPDFSSQAPSMLSTEQVDWLMRSARAVICLCRIQPRRFLYVSPQAEDLFGISIQEWMEDPEAWARQIHPEDRPRALDACHRAAQGCDQRLEYRRLHPDGSLLWIEHSITRTAAGSELSGVMLDITQRRLNEQERIQEHARRLEQAAAAEKRLRDLLEQGPYLTALLCSRGRVQYISPNVEALLGWRDEDLLGKRVWRYMDIQDRSALLNSLKGLSQWQGPRVLRVRVKRSDGDWHRLELHLRRYPGGPASRGLLLQARDLEPELKAEEALQTSEVLHRSIVENSWDLLAVVGPDRRLIQASPSMMAAFGAPMEALLGRDLVGLAEGPDRARLETMLARAYKGLGLSQDQDIRLELPTGPRIFEVRLRMLDQDGAGRVLFKARDVEREREAQDQILQYQRLAVFGQLAAGFAHEVRNPLAGIVGAAQLAERHLAAGQDAAEQVQVVLRQAQRLRQLMDEILNQARAPREAPSRVDPVGVMQKALESARQQFGPGAAGVSVESAMQAGELQVKVTEERLLRLLHNLILNALQALPAQGGRLRLGLQRRGHEAELKVEDNGPGLPKGSVSKAFEPFYTTKPTGSGLGLWIAQSLAREMGGRLEHRPALPRGAAFVLTLPVA